MMESKEGRLQGPAVRAFLNLARIWKLSTKEQAAVLGVEEDTLRSWEAGCLTHVSLEIIERISHLLGIFKAINTLLPTSDRADAWMRAPNAAPLLQGRAAIDVISSGNLADILAVRRYLQAELN